METILTIAAQSVALFTIGYTVIAFAVYAWNRSVGESKPEREIAPPTLTTSQPHPPTPTTAAPTLPDPWEAPIDVVPTPHSPLPSSTVLLLLPPAREIVPVVGKPRRRAAKTITSTQTQIEMLPTTIRELRKLCTQRGFKGAGKWTKAQCLDALAS